MIRGRRRWERGGGFVRGFGFGCLGGMQSGVCGCVCGVWGCRDGRRDGDDGVYEDGRGDGHAGDNGQSHGCISIVI